MIITGVVIHGLHCVAPLSDLAVFVTGTGHNLLLINIFPTVPHYTTANPVVLNATFFVSMRRTPKGVYWGKEGGGALECDCVMSGFSVQLVVFPFFFYFLHWFACAASWAARDGTGVRVALKSHLRRNASSCGIGRSIDWCQLSTITWCQPRIAILSEKVTVIGTRGN